MSPAEQWIARAAVERGYLSAERLEEARREVAARPHPGGLLGLLRERYLAPGQVQALQRAWQERGLSASNATFAVPAFPPTPPTPSASPAPPATPAPPAEFAEPEGGTFLVPAFPTAPPPAAPPPAAPPPVPPPAAPPPAAPPPPSAPPPAPTVSGSPEPLPAPSFRPDGATLPLPPPEAVAATLAVPPPEVLQRALTASTSGGAPGLRLGPFELVRELARGGMGVVWVARRAGLDRQVALKQMLARDGPPHPAHVQRFLDEARLAARLQHPHIVRIHEVGEESGLPWFAMDLVEGGSLEGRIRERGPLPARDGAALFAKLARALAYAHAQRLLHRDLKPANVLITSDGEPVLTDFGLVKSLDDEQGREKLTQQGDLMGTPAYMPPEQAEGQHDRIDQRADVYSLGATFYEALTGFMPFHGRTPVAVLHAVMTQEPTPPRKLVTGLDRDLETVVLRCLEKDPLRRYPSATALAEDLERWLRDEPILARRAGQGERLTRWVRRNRALAGLLGGMAACVLLGLPAGGLWVLHTRAEAALERERGAAAVRERLAGEARGAAEAALAGLAVPSSAETAQLSAGRRQAALDELLGRALAASRAAEQWRSLVPEDQAARQACHQAASLLAGIAGASEQWAVARQAWEEALAVGVDPEGARRGLAQMEAQRRARAEQRRAEVLAILGQLESGELSRQVEGLRGAVMRLVRYTEPELVRLLCERLQSLTRAARAAELELYEVARSPTPDEARAGARPLPPLAEALERRVRGEALVEDAAGALKTAEERMLARARRQRVEARDAAALVARSQAERLGPRGVETAQVLCETLAWIGDPQAVECLREYLEVERDEGRAAHPALALTMLGGAEALAAVQEAARRFPEGGPLTSVREGQLRGVGREAAEEAALLQGLDPADVHMVRQDLPAVQAALDRRLEASPDDAVALAQRAWVRTVRGDIGGARQDAERAAELAPEQGRAWMFLASAFQAMGEEVRARECADQAVERAPHLAQGWAIRADLLRASDPLAAGADLHEALRRAPNMLSARMLLAVVKAELGELREAAILADELEQLAPRACEPWLVRATVALRQSQLPRAREAADRAVELDPQNPMARAMRMEVRSRQGDVAGALEDGEEALRVRPGSFVVLNNSAQLLETLGRLEEAEARYTRCLEILPREPVVLSNRGNVRRRLGRLAEARVDLEQALEVTQMPQAMVNMAHLLRAQGDLAGGLRTFAEAAEAYPDNVEIVREWASFRLGALPDEPAATVEVAERGLAVAPDDPQLLFVRGTARYQLGRREEALADLNRVVELDPHMALAWSNRGWIRRELGDREGALADFGQALQVEPRHVLAWGNRASLKRELGDLPGALADTDEALRLLPGDEELLSFRAGTLVLLEERRAEGLALFRQLAAKDPWAAVWVALLGGDPAPLTPHAAAEGWEGCVVRAARGELGATELLAEAERAQDDATRSGRRCEARWVLGLRAERQGEAEAARAHYQAGAKEGQGTMIEQVWARARAGE